MQSPALWTEYKNDNKLLKKYLKLWRGTDKSDADDSFAAQLSEFYLDGLRNLDKQSKKCVELRGSILNKVYVSNLMLVVVFTKLKTHQHPLIKGMK